MICSDGLIVTALRKISSDKINSPMRTVLFLQDGFLLPMLESG